MHQHCNSLHTIGALRDLQDFMHEPRCPSKAKAKQKLLRNLKASLSAGGGGGIRGSRKVRERICMAVASSFVIRPHSVLF